MSTQFVKTAKFQQLRNWVDDFDVNDDGSSLSTSLGAPAMPPGLEGDEIGRTYMTISQAANEKAHQTQIHRYAP